MDRIDHSIIKARCRLCGLGWSCFESKSNGLGKQLKPTYLVSLLGPAQTNPAAQEDEIAARNEFLEILVKDQECKGLKDNVTEAQKPGAQFLLQHFPKFMYYN